MDSFSILQLIIYAFYVIIIISTIIIVLSENRNPTKALAWLLILIYLPAIGIIFYIFFGQNNRKNKNVYEKYKNFCINLFSNILTDISLLCNNKRKIPREYLSLANLLETSNDSWVLYGSDVEIITKGDRKFDALFNDLENARHHIHMEYFHFRKDETGKKVKELLMRKASQGVEVRFIYENIANIAVFPDFFYEMRKAGVMVLPFSRITLPWIRLRVNYRNHRKVVVIDGEIGYIGGMNVGNEYVDKWRDTHLRILGQGVYGLQSNFMFDWYSLGGIHNGNYTAYFPEFRIHSENLMQIVPDSPDFQWPHTLQAIVQIVSNSRRYIYIQTPYFIPTDSLLQALQSAALGKVDVRLMVSRKSDTFFLDPAAHSYYEELMIAGVRIYESQEKFIHAKMIVSDDYISVIGSTNMDFRSFESSLEINCYMYDQDIGKQCKDIFYNDMTGCKEVILEEWNKRSWLKKTIESVIRLFAPLL